jgi:predicted nucleotidyltransferase
MPTSLLLERLCDELVQRHGVHTVILYGSRANGSALPGSDIDIAAFWPADQALRDTGQFHGEYLDLFIYPDRLLAQPSADDLKLRGGKVMLQRGDEAQRCLAALDALHAAGPAPLPDDELQARRDWARKMLGRIARGDTEGHYRRAWLQMALLEDWFVLRGRWFEGPKRALAWLAEHEPATRLAFDAALAPGASWDTLRLLVEQVVGQVPVDIPLPVGAD